jgi:hypothetical protein
MPSASRSYPTVRSLIQSFTGFAVAGNKLYPMKAFLSKSRSCGAKRALLDFVQYIRFLSLSILAVQAVLDGAGKPAVDKDDLPGYKVRSL